MKQETMARTIIDTLMKKFFRDIEDDPDRSIRNMIDLAINFSRGRFQKEFFQILQEMLSNEQSAYYELVKNVAAGTNHRTLRTFGMNMGFQACTLGASEIRKNEARWNFNIPWAYHLPFGENGLPFPYLDKLISEGKGLGTYVYFLSASSTVTTAHMELLQKHGDCAFILLATPKAILEEWMGGLKQSPNLLVLVENQARRLDETVDELRKHGIFYGLYETAHSESQASLWQPAHLERVAASKAAFYVLTPEDFRDFREDDERKEAVFRIRSQQEYPFVLIDYVSDIQRIDRIVSNDSCGVAFDAKGNICTDTTRERGEAYNICHTALFDLLKKTTKKRPGH